MHCYFLFILKLQGRRKMGALHLLITFPLRRHYPVQVIGYVLSQFYGTPKVCEPEGNELSLVQKSVLNISAVHFLFS